MTGTQASWHRVLGLMTVVSGRKLSTDLTSRIPEQFAPMKRLPIEECRPYGVIALGADPRENSDNN